ncbi:hypothetical protein NHX12_011492 [Muraenolepis orangiensis]|uniref:Uncharacterized protein n=1 Tax=Muraenolepis orangiensis TaxID=630683 RepID=A0A9Q0DJS3_9TELE|nr:hypothetical protein NHX12_011492 [Muraenolepis orangiensis]
MWSSVWRLMRPSRDLSVMVSKGPCWEVSVCGQLVAPVLSWTTALLCPSPDGQCPHHRRSATARPLSAGDVGSASPALSDRRAVTLVVMAWQSLSGRDTCCHGLAVAERP